MNLCDIHNSHNYWLHLHFFSLSVSDVDQYRPWCCQTEIAWCTSSFLRCKFRVFAIPVVEHTFHVFGCQVVSSPSVEAVVGLKLFIRIARWWITTKVSSRNHTRLDQSKVKDRLNCTQPTDLSVEKDNTKHHTSLHRASTRNIIASKIVVSTNS